MIWTRNPTHRHVPVRVFRDNTGVDVASRVQRRAELLDPRILDGIVTLIPNAYIQAEAVRGEQWPPVSSYKSRTHEVNSKVPRVLCAVDPVQVVLHNGEQH